MNNDALFKIGYGLYLLSASENGHDNACIINTVSQVTCSPCRLTIVVNKANLTHDMIINTGVFNLSVLTEETPFDIYKQFGYQSGRTVDKLANMNLPRSANGLVYLNYDANAYISGKVISTTDLGSHTLFLAEVTAAEVLNNQPSVTYDYYQKHVKPAPQPAAKKGFRCKICGYIYEGDTLPPDFICPWCKHGAADFEKIS